MRDDIIYEHLTTEQIDTLDFYERDMRSDILGLIADLHNKGMLMKDAIKLAFDAIKENY